MEEHTTFRPLYDRVLVDREEEPDVRNSGIYIPEQSKWMPQNGCIVAKGSGVSNDVVIGNNVVYNKYSGAEITVFDKEYLIICEDDIMAVLEE